MATVETLVAQCDSREGFSIVGYREVGLPVFQQYLLVAVESVGDIGPVEEFVLRSIDLGVNTIAALMSYLGLPRIVVSSQISSMIYEGLLDFDSHEQKYVLNARGRNRLKETKTYQIKKETVSIFTDGFLRKPTPVAQTELHRSKSIEDLGLEPLAPIPQRPPRVTELSVGDLNRVLNRQSRNKEEGYRIARIEALTGKSFIHFRRSIALAFKSNSGRKIDIGFIVNGVLSEEHEAVFMRNGPEKARLFADLFDSSRRRREIQRVKRENESLLPNAFQRDSRKNTETQSDVGRLTLYGVKPASSEQPIPKVVRNLSVYEHAPMLETALIDAKERVLIISPWIRSNVVDGQFLERLELLLQRDVHVTIAFGIDAKDKGARAPDKLCLAALRDLSQQFENFELVRKGNTHAKVLLVDSRFFVTTSFNWLSFRGDKNMPFREEEGVYIEGTAIVDDYYQSLIARIAAVRENKRQKPR